MITAVESKSWNEMLIFQQTSEEILNATLDMRLILISELTDLKRQMNRDTEWKLQKLSLELFIKMTV